MCKKNQNKMPLVSIVIPCYNQKPDFLFQAVKSALNQTYSDIQVIVSDNHSTNGCMEALNQIEDHRLIRIKPENHLQLVEHFGFAAGNINTKYLSFLSSDDLVSHDFVEKLLPTLENNPQIVMSFGEIENVRHDDISVIRYVYRNNSQQTQIFDYANYIKKILKFSREIGWMPGSLIKTDTFYKAGGINRDNLFYSADYSLLLRLLELGNIYYLNHVTGKNRSWMSVHGKTDAVRIVKSIEDYKKLKLIMLETRSNLSDDINHGFERLKYKQAVLFAWHAGNKELSSEEIKKVKNDEYFSNWKLKLFINLLLFKPVNIAMKYALRNKL